MLNKKKRADSGATEPTQGITRMYKPGTAKLQKIIYDEKFFVKDTSFKVFRVLYADPTGYKTIRQFSFDGSLSYRDCLCKLPQVIDIDEKGKEMRKAGLENYLATIRSN